MVFPTKKYSLHALICQRGILPVVPPSTSLNEHSQSFRFWTITVRIGNLKIPAGTGLTDLATVAPNPICAYYEGGTMNTDVTLTCLKPMSGRYVTFQNKGTTNLEMDEIFIINSA